MPYGTLNADTITNSNGLSGNAIGPGFKNRIINGDMRIDQRNAGAAVTANGAFPVDRFVVANGTDGAYSVQQDSSAPAGFVNSVKFTTTTADGTLTTTQNAHVRQRIEGTNVSDLAWGTANAKTVTLSFWVRSSLTGTFGGSLRNGANDRSYPFTYTISAANTYEYKTVTIAGDTTGTWLTTTGTGIDVLFSLGAGPDRSGTAGAWNSNNNTSATGAVSVIGTLNATWYITGVQLEVGPSATSFDYRPYGTELMLCQRYFQKSYGQSTAIGTASTTPGLIVGKVSSNTVPDGEPYNTIVFPVTMRATPTVTIYGYVGGSGKVSNWAGTDLAASSGEALYIANNGFIVRNNSGGTLTTTQFAVIYHYIASNEL
jgi:hypothetical protein